MAYIVISKHCFNSLNNLTCEPIVEFGMGPPFFFFLVVVVVVVVKVSERSTVPHLQKIKYF